MITPNAAHSPSLFDPFACPSDAYNEAFAGPATPREPWQALMAALDGAGTAVLARRQERIRRMRHEDGATYNPFDDPSGRGVPWALDTIPLPLAAAEWSTLKAGLIQRAFLLEQILADVYGAQNLLKEGRLPAELIFANPNFLQACHGIVPAGNRFLTYYAVDVYRDIDGRFRVLRDYGGNPAGLGYALENRIVLSRVHSELYQQTQIQRLAPFFQTFQRAIIQRADLPDEDPGIVLLSPGPESRIYFEHALLSRYLGYPLVEGQDLTVRNGQVLLKKLAGLEPVAAIFRHIPDGACDPFALRQGTAVGVAGLIQAAREQQIDLVNPIGSGWVDTPALSIFLPDLCRHMMGGDLLLENHPAWWCGREADRNHVLANMATLTVGPALDHSALPPAPAGLTAAITATPWMFMARSPVRPAVAPAWTGKGVEPRRMLLRLFACATEQGFALMPGGMAITAADVETLLGETPERQQSKDIWVLSDQPVVPFSLMSSLRAVPEFRRGSDLPSRVADNLLWLGRYLERAEGVIRLLRSVFRRLSGEAAPDDIPELPYLINFLQMENIIVRPADDHTAAPRFRDLSAHLNGALYDPHRPETVVAILQRVKEAARNVRDRLSVDSWHVINRLEDFADTPVDDPLELLDDTLFTLSAFSGMAMESMTRGLGWRFMDMGRRLERAIHQTGLILSGLPQVCHESRSALEALLEVSDSIMTYRARYRTVFQLAPVLDLLLVDEDNPKSLAFQCSRIAAHVEHLPRPNDRRYATAEERMALEMLTRVRLLDLTGLDCGPNEVRHEGLAAFLTAMDGQLKDFAQQITAHYLSRVPATPHFSESSGGRQP